MCCGQPTPKKQSTDKPVQPQLPKVTNQDQKLLKENPLEIPKEIIEQLKKEASKQSSSILDLALPFQTLQNKHGGQ